MPEAVASQALQQVYLRNLQIPLQVLALVPLSTVEKFQVAAFEVNETTLKLAIVYPEQLKQGFYTALNDIGKKIGRTVQLYRTDHASMQSLIDQYHQRQEHPEKFETPVATPSSPPEASVSVPPPVSEVPPIPSIPEPKIAQPAPSAPSIQSALTPAAATVIPVAEPTKIQSLQDAPPLFELGKSVAYNYLKRIPVEFSRKHRLISVDYLAPNIYWIVSDLAENPGTIEVVKGIEKHNNLVTHLISIKKGEFDDLLRYYEQVHERERNRPPGAAPLPEMLLSELKPNSSTSTSDSLPGETVQPKEQVSTPEVKPEVIPAQDFVVPETQATILSQQEELKGISGFLQRVTQSMSVKHEPAEVVNLTEKPAPTSPLPAATPQPEGTAPATPLAPPQGTPLSPPAAAAPVATKPSADESEADIGKLLDKPIENLDQLKEMVRKGSIPRIVAAIINFAIHEKASDIHLESYAEEVVARYRVDGQLMEIIKMPPDIHAAMVSRIKILSKLRLDETRVPQDGRFDVNFDNAQVDLRVSILPTVHGEKVVMRILDKNRGITSLESLGILGLAYENIIKSISVPFGICLATGPTGSGKSTSLYAILKQIATPNVNVSTLEDPVEYEMKGINQSQIRPKIGFTFAEGLRALLRQDPNIIMVGEIRDGETANMATQAALTGHLVLSTLHTNDAAGAIPRLENMGIEPFLITSSLRMVIGQRLARKICQNCKKEIDLPEGVRDKFKEDVEKIRLLNPLDAARITDPLSFYQGAGCDVCNGKGYQGRIGIYEVLVMTPTLESLTLKRAPGSQIQEQAQKEGMLTMYQDGLLKVLAGQTTLDEVLRETSNK